MKHNVDFWYPDFFLCKNAKKKHWDNNSIFLLAIIQFIERNNS